MKKIKALYFTKILTKKSFACFSGRFEDTKMPFWNLLTFKFGQILETWQPHWHLCKNLWRHQRNRKGKKKTSVHSQHVLLQSNERVFSCYKYNSTSAASNRKSEKSLPTTYILTYIQWEVAKNYTWGVSPWKHSRSSLF